MIIAKDKYATKIWIVKAEGGYDFATDGYVRLTPALARRVAIRLM